VDSSVLAAGYPAPSTVFEEGWISSVSSVSNTMFGVIDAFTMMSLQTLVTSTSIFHRFHDDESPMHRVQRAYRPVAQTEGVIGAFPRSFNR